MKAKKTIINLNRSHAKSKKFLWSWNDREKMHRFPGLTKEEYPLPMLVVETKGLGVGQDLNPNSNVIGYVIFSKKRECCCW